VFGNAMLEELAVCRLTLFIRLPQSLVLGIRGQQGVRLPQRVVMIA
jgi:hypothetical protein